MDVLGVSVAVPTNKAGKRLRLASICYSVPYRGIEHAGGEFILRHLTRLSDLMDVSVLAFLTEANARAQTKVYSGISSVTLVPNSWWGRTVPGRVIRRLFRICYPLIPDPDFSVSFMRSDAVRKDLESSDIVEIQYVEYFHLVRMVRRVVPDAKIIGVVHDIVSERHQRKVASNGPAYERLIGRMSIRLVELSERRLCNSMDELLVFNNDTRRKLIELGVTVPMTVAQPPLIEEGMPPKLEKSIEITPKYIFVGAFDRPENEQGAIWFLKEVWPKIKSEIESASLKIVGANPSERLYEAARRLDDVVVTGYVDDLRPYYQDAGVVVVPLLRGAGVKFKTLTAMLWGKPVVSTPIGSEGIADSRCYLDITDDPARFALASIAAVLEPETANLVAARAHKWAMNEHSERNFLRSITSAYIGMVESNS